MAIKFAFCQVDKYKWIIIQATCRYQLRILIGFFDRKIKIDSPLWKTKVRSIMLSENEVSIHMI